MRKMIKKAISLFLAATMVVTLCPSVQPMNVQAASEDGDAYNLSYGRPFMQVPRQVTEVQHNMLLIITTQQGGRQNSLTKMNGYM